MPSTPISTPRLRLHRVEPVRHTDPMLFPGTTRPTWTPRLAGEGTFPDAPADAVIMAENALERAERSMRNLRALVGERSESDRPRAA